jgi:ferritin-like metal-binding protein YciE
MAETKQGTASDPKSRSHAKERTLHHLFVAYLKDMYYAEKQILKTLPKMAREASSPEIKAAFETHREETEGQVERLQRVFDLLEMSARGKTCEAILGIVEEGKEMMDEFSDSPALDAGLVASAQAVEHYEIARYGTLKSWAEQLELSEAVKLIDQSLQEEIKTDKLLTELAKSSINAQAA